MLSAARIFPGIQTITAIIKITLASSIILYAAFVFFFDSVVYCLGLLAAIFNTKIAQRMWL